jgi:hypothetical protein
MCRNAHWIRERHLANCWLQYISNGGSALGSGGIAFLTSFLIVLPGSASCTSFATLQIEKITMAQQLSPVAGSAIASLTSAVGFATAPAAVPISPLTSRFVPPSYCSREFNNCGFGSGFCNYLLRDVTCGSNGRPMLATDCFPPVSRFPDITAWGGDIAYSPAVACPYGWRTMSDSSTPGVSSGTRVVACCPKYVHIRPQYRRELFLFYMRGMLTFG